MTSELPYLHRAYVDLLFDPDKDSANWLKHGLSFADFHGFDGDFTVLPDERRDYGEIRLRLFGRIGGKGFCLVIVERDGEARGISFRRCREKEMRRYE